MKNTLSSPDSPLAGYVCALLATVIWSGNFIIARGLSEALPPVTLAALRWGVACAALLPFTALRVWRARQIVRARFVHLAAVALVSVTVFNTMIYEAGRTTNALNLSLIAASTPVFIILLSRVFLGEAITRNRLIGLIAAVSGIVLLVTRGDLSVLLALTFREGDLWMLGAAILWAVYSIMIRRKPGDVDPLVFLSVTFALGFLPLIPAALLEQQHCAPWSLTPGIAGAVLYIGVGASLAAYFLWARAVAILGPSRPGMVYYSLPVFCAVEALLFLGESVTWAHGASFALILGGILVATKRGQAK